MAKTRQARRCRAHRSDGQPCGCYAVTGARVCRVHGGAAGQVKRKARERLTEIAAYRVLDSWLSGPGGRELRDRVTSGSDRAVLEAFAARLGG
jgi:hypothetical protein